MNRMISDEVLSIVREMIDLNAAGITLPSHVVTAMTARIDHQDKLIDAYRNLVSCQDRYLYEEDATALGPECLIELDGALQAVINLEKYGIIT